MKELIFLKELILIRQINQNNVCFVVIGILYNNFSSGHYVCDGCYDIQRKSTDFKNVTIIHIKNSAYRIYFTHMSKREAKKFMTNSNLIDKKGIL